MKKKDNTISNIEKMKSIDAASVLENYCIHALHIALGKRLDNATSYDKYKSLALAIKAELIERHLATEEYKKKNNVKKVYYLSLEFLMGRSLQNAADNLDIEETARKSIRKVGVELEELYEQEFDAGLGNGGLGRLAACFLDSMATMNIPGYGYGIRYEYGIFNQNIEDGWQVECADNWLFRGNPWEIQRLDKILNVKFYGRTKSFIDDDGRLKTEWIDTTDILAVPYENLIPGYKTETVNLLTLWSAKSTDQFNLDYFNQGNYVEALGRKDADESISKVLYPRDDIASGKELRLKQQYFFVSASIQQIINSFLENNDDFELFPDKVAIQLNDTHPTIAIPELMRILIDIHGMDWEKAWRITTNTFAYTNHTLLPEALEKWSVSLFKSLLPRLLEIIYEINKRFLEEVNEKYPNDTQKQQALSIIEEGEDKSIRMAYLAIIGSHSINGVAKLHSKLLKENLLPDFYDLWPGKFNNKTNGITQRRWLKQSNPKLSKLITDTIGDGWIKDLFQLKKLEKYSKDKKFQKAWKDVKKSNKLFFADFLKENFDFEINPDSMFDMQVKRIHEYKRQLLNILYVVALYNKIKSDPNGNYTPRTVMIGGKAAPSYQVAKLIIKLVNDVAAVINNDPQTSDYLKLFFLPNYRVSLAEKIFPASDLSEQISTAGKEASGTGNMKFSLNGALTIGTLDGANIEIKDAVGDDNIFIFGLTIEEVMTRKAEGYNPRDYYNSNEELKKVLDMIANGYFSPDDVDRFKPLINDSLLNGGDQYMLLADFDSYLKCQDRVAECYSQEDIWTEKSIINVANMGYFSSDRTIAEYADEIWNVKYKV